MRRSRILDLGGPGRKGGSPRDPDDGRRDGVDAFDSLTRERNCPDLAYTADRILSIFVLVYIPKFWPGAAGNRAHSAWADRLCVPIVFWAWRQQTMDFQRQDEPGEPSEPRSNTASCAPCNDQNCCCNGGRASLCKTLICAMVMLLAVGVTAYSMVKKNVAAPSSNCCPGGACGPGATGCLGPEFCPQAPWSIVPPRKK